MTDPASLRRGDRPSVTFVEVGPLTLLFSYETVVAFAVDGWWRASENRWGNATGVAINQSGVPAKDRLKRADFTAELAAVVSRLGGGSDG